MSFDLPGDYHAGTISVVHGSTTVTGVGTAFISGGALRESDDFQPDDFGLTVPLESVTDETHFELAYGWPGADISGGTYRVKYNSDINRLQGAAASIMQSLVGGSLLAIAGLAFNDGDIIQSVGGSLTNIPLTSAISGLTKLGIGMAPVNALDITQNQNDSSVISILNSSNGANALARLFVSNGSYIGAFSMTGTGAATSGLSAPNRAILQSNGSNGLAITTVSGATPILFGINNVLVAQFSPTNSAFLVGTTASLSGSVHNFYTGVSASTLALVNTHATGPAGLQTYYSAASPNDTGHEFLYCSDSSALRMAFMSNGGIRNYSANNANLSDMRVKPHIEHLADDRELSIALWKGHRAIDWNRHKYDDQTHDDWNYGYTAQGIQKAFAEVAPELVDFFDEKKKLLGVYHHDVTNISGAVLSMAQCRIEALEQTVASLKALVSVGKAT